MPRRRQRDPVYDWVAFTEVIDFVANPQGFDIAIESPGLSATVDINDVSNIVRVRGTVQHTSGTPTNAGLVHMGIIYADADLADSDLDPSNADDLSRDGWLWHSTMLLTPDGPDPESKVHVDTKAQRVLTDEMRLAFIAQRAPDAGQVEADFRVLFRKD